MTVSLEVLRVLVAPPLRPLPHVLLVMAIPQKYNSRCKRGSCGGDRHVFRFIWFEFSWQLKMYLARFPTAPHPEVLPQVAAGDAAAEPGRYP